MRRVVFAACWLLLATAAPRAQPAAPASSPVPGVAATQPDPRDFITRAQSDLILQQSRGGPLRFGGVSISWLGLRDDSGAPADARFPTHFEVADALATAQALGVGYISALSLGASAGCTACLAPTPGKLNADALRQVDHVLKMVRDAGLKVIIPLAGPGNGCAPQGDLDPVYGTPCTFARWRAKPDASFYTDPQVRDDFAHFVLMLLNHLNPETGIAYKDDPTILAWENCAGCGAQADTKTLADWTEFLGRTIKTVDSRHLYENGALAGRLGNQPGAATQADIGQPSVDIVGDRVAGHPGLPPDSFVPALNNVLRSGRIYFIDEYGWNAATFPTLDDLAAFYTAVWRHRTLSAAITGDLSAHAEMGGFLPPVRAQVPSLYFPGIAAQQTDAQSMQARARAIRRFSYTMMDMVPRAFNNADAPVILSAQHGKLRWRGSAGALKYSIERSQDITTTGSWVNLCDQCATDTDPQWQDPAPPSGPTWYRVTPYNANMHTGIPSDPFQNK